MGMTQGPGSSLTRDATANSTAISRRYRIGTKNHGAYILVSCSPVKLLWPGRGQLNYTAPAQSFEWLQP
jgi:hypothetical protein